MECNQLERYLEQGMEQELPAEAVGHLSCCQRCRAIVADLEAIRVTARQLAEEDATPPERIWMSLRAQLESEGLIQIHARTMPRTLLGRWWQAMPGPVVAGATASLLLAVVVSVGYLRFSGRKEPLENVDLRGPVVGALHEHLAEAADQTVSAKGTYDPAVNESFRENLRIVDDLIVLCEKSVRENPQSELAREYLYGAYQQKADLLAIAADSGLGGDR